MPRKGRKKKAFGDLDGVGVLGLVFYNLHDTSVRLDLVFVWRISLFWFIILLLPLDSLQVYPPATDLRRLVCFSHSFR